MKKSAIVFFFAAILSVAAVAQSVQEGVNHFYAERYESAKNTFQKLISSNPNNLEAIYWLGQTFIYNDDVDAARELYKKTLAANGNAPVVMVGMGHIHLLDGKKAEARQLFESAITASKSRRNNDPAILTAIGRANVHAYSDKKPLGDLDYAIAKLNEAGNIQPNNPDIFLVLGNAYRKKHSGGDAILAYRKAGNYAPALYRTASLYRTQNNWDVVLENLNSAIAADPKFAPAYLDLYDYYLNVKRDFPTAEQWAKKFTDNADPSVDNDYLLAQTLYVQQKYSDAIASARNILAKSPNAKPRVYRLLAYSYLASKDTAAACENTNQFLAKAGEEDIIGQDYILQAQTCGRGNPQMIFSAISKAVAMDSVLSRQVKLLDEAIENAKKSGDRNLEGELGLYRYKLVNKDKPNPAEFVALGVPFYYAEQFKKADSLFSQYSVAYPDSIYGYLWSSRALRQIDKDRSQGLAVPAFENTLRIAAMDPTRDFYKSAATGAAAELAIYHYNVKRDKEKSVMYLRKGLEFNPSDETLISILKQIDPNAKLDVKVKSEDGETKVKVKQNK